MKILLATTNYGKIKEIMQYLSSLFVELDSLNNHPGYISPEENGLSFIENAKIKASTAAKHFNCWALADDSGLVVPVLKGAPGIFSARFAGPDASDKENNTKLLAALKGYNDFERRAAFFECAIALSSPLGEIVKVFEGTCAGYIAFEPKGSNGFGYDPLFIKHGYDKSFAELTLDVKQKISHRHKALEKLKIYLEHHSLDFIIKD